MLDGLQTLLHALPREAPRSAYNAAIVDNNLLGKRTVSTRRLTAQRLSELYGLDPSVPLFRFLRLYWPDGRRGNELLALLLALARDPLLRATADCVLQTRPGEEFARPAVTEALHRLAGGRLSDGTLDKVVRNAASTWTQSGHLRGRVRKVRQVVSAAPASAAFALLLGYAVGIRGEGLLRSTWMRVLDVSAEDALALCADAKRLGLVGMSYGGGLVDVSFSTILTEKEKELFRGTC